ncbi:glutamate racemase [Bowmanella denitrificans]|uniref:glutamate racemase n=1 Tax=Bowmanella denitrificans TaxID=366582 RepID=UPI0031DE928A
MPEDPAPDLNHLPIGVFDSGLGGLSVLQEIRHHLPAEHLIYVADSAHAPYGRRSTQDILKRCIVIRDFLYHQSCKAMVVACNSATAICIDTLRATSPFPVIGIEPAIKPAALASSSGKIGLLATQATLESNRFQSLLQAWAGQCKVFAVPCPGFVECIERGDLNGPQVRALASPVIQDMLCQGVDTLVLGCTHYPFLIPLLTDLSNGRLNIINPAPAVARQLQRRLHDNNLLNVSGSSGQTHFYSSSLTAHTAAIISQLWGQRADVQLMR